MLRDRAFPCVFLGVEPFPRYQDQGHLSMSRSNIKVFTEVLVLYKYSLFFQKQITSLEHYLQMFSIKLSLKFCRLVMSEIFHFKTKVCMTLTLADDLDLVPKKRSYQKECEI